MSYTVSELNPRKPVLILNKEEIVISLVTLHHHAFIAEVYGSIQEMYDQMREKPVILLDVIWMLLVDKKRFENSLEVFKNFALTSSESIADWSKRMSACLDESINKSMPVIKNKKRYQEIQQINGSTTSETPCYAVYFDSIAKRYGYTLEQFYDLTLRNIHIFLKTIDDESYKELEVQAALQGRKLKPRIKFEDISEEEEAQQDQDALDALERLQKEYEAKKDK